MKVFLTGYTGLLGHHIAEVLHNHGYKIRILLNKTTVPWRKFPNDWEFLFGSIDDREVIKKAVKDVQVVIHCAWAFSPQTTERPTVNERGTELLITESVAAGVEYFAFISSVAVYGMNVNSNQIIDENSSFATGNQANYIYPSEKINIEKMLINVNRNETKLGIFRPGPIFDENNSPINKMITIGKITLGVDIGKGNNHMAFIHTRDVADAILRWIEKSDNNSVFNVTPSNCIIRRNWYKNWGKINGLKIRPIFIRASIFRLLFLGVRIIKRLLRRKSIANYNYAIACATRNIIYSNERIKRELNWEDKFTYPYTN